MELTEFQYSDVKKIMYFTCCQRGYTIPGVIKEKNDCENLTLSILLPILGMIIPDAHLV